jgi:hypothetical protein
MAVSPAPEATGTVAAKPIRPEPIVPGEIRTRFVRGRVSPRGVVWFGARSFWGHLRHFLAAAIATEDIDSRDWMNPDRPEDLGDRVAEVLGGKVGQPSLTAALGRDLWIDYVSDTGDDVSVSAAVARLIVENYELPDPERPGATLTAPRGDILLFGGDTAYPVATAQEIANRVLVPFNRALERVADGKSRVLLGIPGNHDWYDGLDGFGRMFRRREPGLDDPRPSMFGISRKMLEHYTEWARELVRGGKIEKPRSLVLSGYTPLQNASYFVLPMSPTVHLYAVDRQLKTIDSQQRRFHFDWYREHPEAAAWVLLPDPLYRFGGASRTGTQMVQALGLDFASRPHFLLSGDVHHYERLADDGLLHVIAGGGGAFLHPAPMFEGRLRAELRWPNARQSRALLRQVPWKIARGRSGFLPHWALAAVFAPAMAASAPEQLHLFVIVPLTVTLVIGTVYLFIGGIRRRPRSVAALAYATAAITAGIPIASSLLLNRLLFALDFRPSAWVVAGITFLLTVFVAAGIFGAYLALLARFGLEQTQAFTALDHPGFKHFVRFRVHADGRGVDGYCIGLVDPLHPGAQPVLVDQFLWRVD